MISSSTTTSTSRSNGRGRRDIAEVMQAGDLNRSTTRAKNFEARRLVEIAKLRGVVDDTPPGKPPKKDIALTEDFADEGWDIEKEMLCLNPLSDGSLPRGMVGSGDEPALVHKNISSVLKKHQIVGTRFIWSHIDFNCGCVLADYMGLGKTIQVISVIEAFLSRCVLNSEDGALYKKWNTVLIVAPAICVRNWEAEFKKWLSEDEIKEMGLMVLESSKCKSVKQRVAAVKKWNRKGGVCIMGYEMYRQLAFLCYQPGKVSSSYAMSDSDLHKFDIIGQVLCNPGPDLVVLDEAHRLRNEKSQIVEAMSYIKTKKRILLTGYPLQNHLREYWTMIHFARPNYLGNLYEFKNMFSDPIENGQYKDSNEDDILLSRKRSFILVQQLESIVLRRNQSYLTASLPPKKEWVIMCKLSPLQKQLYEAFLRFKHAQWQLELQKEHQDKNSVMNVLEAFHVSIGISNHPDILFDTIIKNELKRKREAQKEQELDEQDSDYEFEQECKKVAIPAKKQKQKFRFMADGPKIGDLSVKAKSSEDNKDDDDDDSDIEELGVISYEEGCDRLGFAAPYLKNHKSGELVHSGKMSVLFEILRECITIGDRVTIFSQSLTTINVIEELIYSYNESCYRKKEQDKSWRTLRIDGSVSQLDRFGLIQEFNDPSSDVNIMLVSTKAGGEGVNLVGGNRVIIFDVCWNPSHDNQAMCRSYRFGQQNPVHIYRLISAATLEKTVYNKQVRKEGCSKRVVDDTPVERKFTRMELEQYFSIENFHKAQAQVMPDEDVRPTDEETKESENAENVAPIPPSPLSTIEAGTKKVSLTDAVNQETEKRLAWRKRRYDEKKFKRGFKAPEQKVWTYDTNLDRASVRRDPALKNVLARASDWLADYYQQETMFEEDSNQYCSELEKAQAKEEYEICSRSMMNPFYDPDDNSTEGGMTTSTATDDKILRQVPMPPRTTKTPVRTYTVPEVLPRSQRTQLFTPKKSQTTTPQSVTKSNVRVLLIRRGIKNADDIIAAAKARGIAFEMELSSSTTHIVSNWVEEKVLKWLKLDSLPANVKFRNSDWLSS